MPDTSLLTSALIRATIFVRDLDRAARFYAALGFTEIYFEGTLEDASACSLLGLTHIHPFAIRILKQPGPNFGMVGLFQLDTKSGAEDPPIQSGPVRFGEVAVVFYVTDLTKTLAALREAGAVWSPEPEMFRLPHREQREVCLRDTDGVLMNLVETDPAQQWREYPELHYAAPEKP